MPDPRLPVRCWSCQQRVPLHGIGAHVQDCLTTVINRREHFPELFDQRLYRNAGRWWVWLRTDEPPYHRGAERFRPWKPRHLLAAWQQWRSDRRNYGPAVSLRYWRARRQWRARS